VAQRVLEPLAPDFTLWRLPAGSPWPAAALNAPCAFLARTEAEVSLLLPSSVPGPAGARGEPHWRGWRVQGPLAFDLVGILAELAQTLAQAGIPLLAVSTFDTDYIFVRAAQAQAAEAAWQAAGWRVAGA